MHYDHPWLASGRGRVQTANLYASVKAIDFIRFKTPIVSATCALLACGFATPALAQGLPVDWSHRYLIDSNPETRQEAEANGTLDQWIKRSNDPRFVLQLERKERALAAKAERAAGENPLWYRPTLRRPRTQAPVKPRRTRATKSAPTSVPQVHRDWSNVMGGAGGVGGPLVYPAKYAFGVSAKDCVNDFVVFTTSVGGGRQLRHVFHPARALYGSAGRGRNHRHRQHTLCPRPGAHADGARQCKHRSQLRRRDGCNPGGNQSRQRDRAKRRDRRGDGDVQTAQS